MTWSSSVPWGPKAMTLSGSVRLDRTPGITAAWVALTGIAPDGQRHLIGDPTYVEATFNGTTLDWLRANWDPVVIVCLRHPLDVVASGLALRIPYALEWLAPSARAQR